MRLLDRPVLARHPSPVMARTAMMVELYHYVGFTDDDAAHLARLGPVLRPHFPAVVDAFYDAIEGNAAARAVFKGGAPQIARQKAKLRQWLEGLVSGRYDEAYWERRARIGRVHVAIDLDQRFMFSAMNVVRRGLHRAIDEATVDGALAAHDALDRIVDLELALMLETYRDRYVERQRASERLATIGQLAASIGHELRNPLAVVETSLHLLRRRVQDPKVLRHVDRIGQQVQLSSTIIDDLLAMARDRPPTFAPVEPEALFEEVVGAVSRPEGVRVELDVADGVESFAADGSQMRQVLVNLLTNAVQALQGRGGRVVLRYRADPDGRARLEVEDDGPGIDESVRSRLFEPLVTTRTTGIGLGLALCARIVEGHGGSLEALDVEPGALFRVTLPPPATTGGDEAPPDDEPPSAGRA